MAEHWLNHGLTLRKDVAHLFLLHDLTQGVALLVLGVTFIGESLNDISDPRLRARRRLKQLVSTRDKATDAEGAAA